MKRRCTAVVLLLIAIGACSAPATPAEPSPPTAENRYGAPPVTTPRDLSSRAADPCGTLLGPLELDQLGYAAPGSPDRTALGTPVCSYNDDTRRGADVTVDATRDRLVDAYRSRVFDIFVPTTIDGLPATHEKSFPAALTCTTAVSVGASQSIVVDSVVEGGRDGPPPVDPCDDGRRVAEAVVSTLPPA